MHEDEEGGFGEMGIFIHLCISKAVSRQEWESVYEETLELVRAFPLAERQKVKCHGIETICLVKTEEREDAYGWNNENTRIGWFTEGDYETMHTAEEYRLLRNLVREDNVEPDAGDAIMGALPAYLRYDWEDPRFNHIYDLWGGKTQGEPYHMCLLAIACLVESRLGEKAFVYGDITRGQCVKAVEMANDFLTEPIEIPARCDLDRFSRRVAKLPLTDMEKLAVFEQLYLGTKDAEFGNYMRTMYSEKAQDDYWRARLGEYPIGTRGFDEEFKNYLAWGFDLRKLCGFVNFYDRENVPQYEKFVNKVMKAKLHLPNKNSDDLFDIDQEEPRPYGIYTLMAQFVFAGARNPKVDRYIPIDQIKQILISELGDKCDVGLIIDEYLKKEAEAREIRVTEDTSRDELDEMYRQDVVETVQQAANLKMQRNAKRRREYDAFDYEDLIYYEKGDTMHPALQAALIKNFAIYHSITEEETYDELLRKSVKERCEWLADQNKWLVIRDKDWNKIYNDIEEHEDSFVRYYPMVRVDLDSKNMARLVTAIVLNDEIYAYCMESLQNAVEMSK